MGFVTISYRYRRVDPHLEQVRINNAILDMHCVCGLQTQMKIRQCKTQTENVMDHDIGLDQS